MAVADLPSNPQSIAPYRVYLLDTNGAIVSPAAASGAGTEFAEDAAHSSGALGTLLLGVRRDADTSLSDTTGDYTPLQFDALGNLKVNVKAGTASGIVDNAGFTDGTTVVTLIAGVFDAVAGTALTENDAAAIRIDAKRALIGSIEDATTRGQGLAVNAAGSAQVQGQVASDGVAAGNPVYVGGYASTAAPTSMSADGDVVPVWLSRKGVVQAFLRDINNVDAFGEVQATPTAYTLLGRLKDLTSSGTPYDNILLPTTQILGSSGAGNQYTSDTNGWNKLVITLGGFSTNTAEAVALSWSTTVSDQATCKSAVDSITTLGTGKFFAPDGVVVLNTVTLWVTVGRTFEIDIDPLTPVKTYGVGVTNAVGGLKVQVTGLRAG